MCEDDDVQTRCPQSSAADASVGGLQLLQLFQQALPSPIIIHLFASSGKLAEFCEHTAATTAACLRFFAVKFFVRRDHEFYSKRFAHCSLFIGHCNGLLHNSLGRETKSKSGGDCAEIVNRFPAARRATDWGPTQYAPILRKCFLKAEENRFINS